MRTGGARALVVLALALAAPAALPAPARAHDVPAEVVVRAFVRPEPGRLRLLVRVPLASMRDVQFPLRGAYLDLAATRPLLRDLAALWIAGQVELFEDGAPLGAPAVVATRISLPSDPSFAGWESALAHVGAEDLADDVDLVLEQAMMDVLLEVPIAAADARFTIAPSWADLGVRTSTVLIFLPPGGGERLYRYDGDPGLVPLDPRWHQAALRFVASGFRHVLGGLDHLLFLLCLAVPMRRVAGLVPIVTAFTVAHSITLLAAATASTGQPLWFPSLVETLIAFSIVWMALENVVRTEMKRRWMVAFGFGLVHGFGFSFVLREELQFAGRHALAALLSFNVGVELGQLFALVLAVPVLTWLFRRAPERILTIVLSVSVAHTAWHWMTERGSAFLSYPLRMPAPGAIRLDDALRWGMVAVVAAGAAWGLALLFDWWGRRGASAARAIEGGQRPAAAAAVR
jgi:hypothetical protein